VEDSLKLLFQIIKSTTGGDRVLGVAASMVGHSCTPSKVSFRVSMVDFTWDA
jgi:hypothetical protein